MASITKPATFSAGATIIASEHNDNFDTIYNDHNTNITNVNISASAAIVDTKLAQLTTASKVNLSALVISSQTAGDIIYASSATALTRLAAGSSGQVLQSAGTAAPAWASAGKVLQVVNVIDATSSSTTLRYVIDNNAPVGTFSGAEFMSLAFTPTVTDGNRLMITCQGQLATSSGASMICSLHESTATTSAAIAVASESDSVDGQRYNMMLVHFVNSSTTAATTFRFKAGGSDAGTVMFNAVGAQPLWGGTAASSMTIVEFSNV